MSDKETPIDPKEYFTEMAAMRNFAKDQTMKLIMANRMLWAIAAKSGGAIVVLNEDYSNIPENWELGLCPTPTEDGLIVSARLKSEEEKK